MRIAFFVPSLSASQMSYNLIKNLNEFYERDRSGRIDFAVFYEQEIKPCIEPDFLITNATDAWNYSGQVISTTLSTAHKAIRFPKAKHTFYPYDVEWVGMPQKQYEILGEIYQTPQRIFARSEDHAHLIDKVWNRQVRGVVGDFDIKKILEGLI